MALLGAARDLTTVAATVKYGHEQAGHPAITARPRTGGIPGRQG